MDGSTPVSAGIAELGLDIIRVERIREALERFGDRFVGRVLTPAEARYVRGRPETFAGAGRRRRRSARSSASASAASAGGTSRSSGSRRASRRSGSMGGRPRGPTSSAWSAWR